MAISNIQNQYFHSRWRGNEFWGSSSFSHCFLVLVSFSGQTVDCSSILSCAVMFYYPKDLTLLSFCAIQIDWITHQQNLLVSLLAIWLTTTACHNEPLYHENHNQQVWKMAGNVSEKWWRSSGGEHEHTLETTKAVSSWADICTTHTWRTSACLCA